MLLCLKLPTSVSGRPTRAREGAGQVSSPSLYHGLGNGRHVLATVVDGEGVPSPA